MTSVTDPCWVVQLECSRSDGRCTRRRVGERSGVKTDARVYSCFRRVGSSASAKGRQTMSDMATVRETHHVARARRHGLRCPDRRLDPYYRSPGVQPVDFWAFCKEDHFEFLSCEHTKPSIGKLIPQVGDSAYTNPEAPRSSRSWKTPRPASTTCSSPRAIRHVTPSLGSRVIMRKLPGEPAHGVGWLRHYRSSSPRSPGTCSPTSRSSRTTRS